MRDEPNVELRCQSSRSSEIIKVLVHLGSRAFSDGLPYFHRSMRVLPSGAPKTSQCAAFARTLTTLAGRCPQLMDVTSFLVSTKKDIMYLISPLRISNYEKSILLSQNLCLRGLQQYQKKLSVICVGLSARIE